MAVRNVHSGVFGGATMKESSTLRPERATANTWLLQVGSEVYPVYGSVDVGWSVERIDSQDVDSTPYRYGSLEELFFALVNFSVCEVGET
jgi:hypothetical protein